jgi:hypothetical protein
MNLSSARNSKFSRRRQRQLVVWGVTAYSLVNKSSPYNRPWRHKRVADIQLYCVFNLGAKCKCLVNATPRPLWPRDRDPTAIEQGVGWASWTVWMGAEVSHPLQFDPQTFQPESNRNTGYAVPTVWLRDTNISKEPFIMVSIYQTARRHILEDSHSQFT